MRARRRRRSAVGRAVALTGVVALLAGIAAGEAAAAADPIPVAEPLPDRHPPVHDADDGEWQTGDYVIPFDRYDPVAHRLTAIVADSTVGWNGYDARAFDAVVADAGAGVDCIVFATPGYKTGPGDPSSDFGPASAAERTELADHILAGREFSTLAGTTSAAFVGWTYDTVLSRTPTAVLRHGDDNDVAVAIAMAKTPEYRRTAQTR